MPSDWIMVAAVDGAGEATKHGTFENGPHVSTHSRLDLVRPGGWRKVDPVYASPLVAARTRAHESRTCARGSEPVVPRLPVVPRAAGLTTAGTGRCAAGNDRNDHRDRSGRFAAGRQSRRTGT